MRRKKKAARIQRASTRPVPLQANRVRPTRRAARRVASASEPSTAARPATPPHCNALPLASGPTVPPRVYPVIIAAAPPAVARPANSCATRTMASVYSAPPTPPHTSPTAQNSHGDRSAKAIARLAASNNSAAPVNTLDALNRSAAAPAGYWHKKLPTPIAPATLAAALRLKPVARIGRADRAQSGLEYSARESDARHGRHRPQGVPGPALGVRRGFGRRVPWNGQRYHAAGGDQCGGYPQHRPRARAQQRRHEGSEGERGPKPGLVQPHYAAAPLGRRFACQQRFGGVPQGRGAGAAGDRGRRPRNQVMA